MKDSILQEFHKNNTMAIIAFMLSLIVLLSGYAYYRDSAEVMVEYSFEKYLHQDSRRLAGNIEIQLMDCQSYLRGVDQSYNLLGIDKDSLKQLLDDIQESSPFDVLYFAEIDGTSYVFDNGVNLADRSYFLKALNGEGGVSELLVNHLDGNETFAVYQPITDKATGKVSAVLIGGIYVDTFLERVASDHRWADNNESGPVYTTIIDNSGNIVLSFDKKNISRNIFKLISDFDNSAETSVELDVVKDMVALGKSASLKYKGLSGKSMVCFEPLNVNGWYLTHNASSEMIAARGAEVDKIMLPFVGMITLSVILALFGLGVLIRKRRLEKEQAAQRIHQIELEDEIKTSFMRYISHDLRTPLNALKGFNSLAAEAVRDENYEKLPYYLERSEQISRYFSSIIDKVLKFNEIRRDGIELEQIPFYMSRLVQSSEDMVSFHPNSNGVSFTASLNHDLKVEGDLQKLKNMLFQFLDNSLNFSRPGGSVNLKIETSDVDNNYTEVVFTISDNGIGMAPEQLENLGRPFSKVDNQINAGTDDCIGLGIWVAKSIAEAMGGSVSFESVQGEGTTVTVKLKLKRIDDGFSEIDYSKIPILVVDDNELNREIASEILTSLGFPVKAVASGREALDMLESAQPLDIKVVLTDISMPEMNGFQLAQSIRNHERNDIAGILIIALSALNTEDDHKRARAAGINGYLNKPFDSQLFTDKLKALL